MMDNKFESIITESRKRQLELFGKKKKNKDTKSSNSNEKLDIESIKQIVSSATSLDVFDDGNNRLNVGVDKNITEPIDNFESNFNSIYKKLENSGFKKVVNSKTSSTDFNNGSAYITLKNNSGQQVQVAQGYNDDVGDNTVIRVSLK